MVVWIIMCACRFHGLLINNYSLDSSVENLTIDYGQSSILIVVIVVGFVNYLG